MYLYCMQHITKYYWQKRTSILNRHQRKPINPPRILYIYWLEEKNPCFSGSGPFRSFRAGWHRSLSCQYFHSFMSQARWNCTEEIPTGGWPAITEWHLEISRISSCNDSCCLVSEITIIRTNVSIKPNIWCQQNWTTVSGGTCIALYIVVLCVLVRSHGQDRNISTFTHT